MKRVFIHEKLINGRRHASSSPTAITERRYGTAARVTKQYVDIHFDNAPGVTTRVKRDCVFEVMSLALESARDMVAYCDRNKHYGYYTDFTNSDEALTAIATGTHGFGDICDDNMFIARVMFRHGLGSDPDADAPEDDDVEVLHSDGEVDLHNEIYSYLALAATKLLEERKEAK